MAQKKFHFPGNIFIAHSSTPSQATIRYGKRKEEDERF
ncbi:hypothetical protein UYSO10_3150 [Kosakonia radicincitans]|nr:hypothetical protein UYSO10_3150 [Kosakonia radicincitans]